MDCPYIIRENIGFGRVREHGYYQLDEMAYDLTHDFANADVEVKRVGGITRASASREQYDDAIIIPMAKEWAVLDRADIGDHYRVIEFKDNAINMFEQKTERKWCNRPFYDEVRLYHNGMLVRLSVNGHEFIF